MTGAPFTGTAPGGTGGAGIDVAVFAPTTARYVRVVGQTRATQYGHSMWEVGVYAR